MCFRPDQLNRIERPLEFNIGTGLWKFLKSFWQLNHNFLMAPIVNNPMFIRGRGDNGRIDSRLVDDQVIGRLCYDNHKEAWLKLTVKDMFFNGICISFDSFQLKMVFPCTLISYMHIRKAAIHAITKYNGNILSNKICEPVHNFLSKNPKALPVLGKFLASLGTGQSTKE